jgi:hypothetical protein
VLLTLIHYNRMLIYNLLFRIAAQTLQTFAKNRWDGRLGIIMVLHTWGQTLNDHPHVHCIVTGGVLKNDGSRFIRAPKNFLFSVEALSPVFRQKFIEALDALYAKGTLNLSGQPELRAPNNWQHLRQALYRHSWVVYAKWVFHANWTPIPAQAGHPFHGNLDSRSEATRGVNTVYAVMGSSVNFGWSFRSDSPSRLRGWAL